MLIGVAPGVPVGLKRMMDARSCRPSRNSHLGSSLLNLRKARAERRALRLLFRNQLFVLRNHLMLMTSSPAEEPDLPHPRTSSRADELHCLGGQAHVIQT